MNRKLDAWINYSNWLVGYSGFKDTEKRDLIKLIKQWLIQNIKTSGNISSLRLLKEKLVQSNSILRVNYLDFVRIYI
jgi:hypothetical protein